MRDPQTLQRGSDSSANALARPAQVLRPESDLTLDIAGDDLAIWILQDRADQLGQLCQAHAGRRLSIDRDPAAEIAAVAARDQAVQAAQQSRFAAAAPTGDQQQIAGSGDKVQIAN